MNTATLTSQFNTIIGALSLTNVGIKATLSSICVDALTQNDRIIATRDLFDTNGSNNVTEDMVLTLEEEVSNILETIQVTLADYVSVTQTFLDDTYNRIDTLILAIDNVLANL